MADTNLHTNNMFVDTDIFVVNGDEGVVQDFVFIDNDIPEAVVIDMSQDEFLGAITIDIDVDSDSFVTIDEEDQIFVADFTEDDFSDNDWLFLDLADNINI